MVAVDFSADWIEKQAYKQLISIAVVTAVSVAIGIAFAYSISVRFRKRIEKLNGEMGELEDEFKELDKMMKLNSVKKLYLMPDSQQGEVLKTLASGEMYGTDDSGDEIALLDKDLRAMVDDMKRYIEYIHAQTYIDQITGVGNRLSYKEALGNIDELIRKEGKNAKFVVGMFDINGLEMINTKYGFETGDEMLYAAGTLLRNAYGHRKVFRIASDEFVVVIEDKGLLDMDEYGKSLNSALAAFNSGRDGEEKPKLGISRGTAAFRPGEDKNYRDVIMRAEQAIDWERKKFYEKLANDQTPLSSEDQ